MRCQFWDGEKRTERNIGSPGIRGEVTGGKAGFLELSEESETSISKETAHGPYLPTLGPKMSEIKLNLINKKLLKTTYHNHQLTLNIAHSESNTKIPNLPSSANANLRSKNPRSFLTLSLTNT
jgi:hypothetical protein